MSNEPTTQEDTMSECDYCGGEFDQAIVRERDELPGNADTEFCSEFCYQKDQDGAPRI